MRRTRAGVVLALLLLLWKAGAAEAEPLRFVALSDLHWEPAASGILPALDAAPVAEWAALLDAAPAVPSSVARYGADAPWELLRSAPDAAARAAPDAAFVLLTGDLLGHHFRRSYRAAMPEGDDAHYAAFVRKTMAFVLGQVAARFPGRPVYPTLGNNDDTCGDYRLEPGGPFLRATEPMAQAAAHVPEAEAGAFARDWISGVGTDVANPALPATRMVFLNSVFFSRNYANTCGGGAPGDPGREALDWFEGRLASAEAHGETVWLLLHIPPGGDAFADLRQGACPAALLPMWRPEPTRRFLALMQRYGRIVRAAFAGHTHMDEFRLIGPPEAPVAVSLSTPGISPVFGQNPGFHVYTLDAAGRLADRETWIVDNMRRTSGAEPLRWVREYGFDALWELPGLDPPSLARLNEAIQHDARARTAWFSVYRVGNPAMWGVPDVQSLPPRVFRTYTCAIGFTDPDAYARCVCPESQ